MARNSLDDNWVVEVPLTAGVHEIRATFLMKTGAVSEGFRKPFLKPYIGRGTDDERETREGAALRELEIMGPLNPGGGATLASYKRVFVCRPAGPSEETACARTILSKLARRAYRRPVTAADVDVLMDFYQEGRAAGTFDTGVELALQRILDQPVVPVPHRVRAGRGAPAGVYRISDIALASRLSFFLWSSIPDESCSTWPRKGTLHEPAVLERQTRRMLADPRSEAFINNFAGQWLSLRRLPDIVPDPFLFPDYGDTLALAFRREVELFFDSIVREDRPAIDLLTANYTFVNERLAQHYGIPHVKGINFRRVTLAEDSPRRGLLGKGAILTVTAFPNRTSPVVRGKWVLQNAARRAAAGTAAERAGPAGERRESDQGADAARAAGAAPRQPHVRVVPQADGPAGLRARELRRGRASTGPTTRTTSRSTTPASTPTARESTAPAGLRQVLVDHSDQFFTNVTKTLLTYALGRGVEYYDAPAVRAILRDAAPQNYRFSSIVLGIVKSTALPDEEIGLMIITKKALSRRTVPARPRGVGGAAACSTPWCRP